MFLLRILECIFVLEMLSILRCKAQSTDFQTDCDAFYNNSCFIYVKFPSLKWADANTDCVSRGGYLTSINSVNENDMLASLVANVPGNVAISNAWIGLDYTSYMGSTNWLDGTPITYSKESDTPGTYPLCIVITGTGTWRAFSCNDEREYICKKLGGSVIAIKDNGQYKSIGNGSMINTVPTTLVCRTDTYQSMQITWEFKSMDYSEWTSIQGSWDETTGISELNIANYGHYRCHVRSGGSDQIYTATAIDPTITTQIDTGTTYSFTELPTKVTNIQTTPKLVSTSAVIYTSKNLKNATIPYFYIIGGIVALLVFLLCLLVAVVCIITVLLLYQRKKMKRATQFKRIPKDDEKIKYENVREVKTEIELGETNLNRYNRMEVANATDSNEYLNLSDVTNQPLGVTNRESVDYTPMLGVENRNINLRDQHSHYENRPELEYLNIGDVTMGIDENPPPDSKQSNEMDFSIGTDISDVELRRQFRKLNYKSEKSQKQTSGIAIEPENKPKNPIENVLPYDNNRVVLMSEDGGNNYINASYIDNYQFIATTHPMQNTLTDFLTMIYQIEANLVVLLTTKNELSEIEWNISKHVAYWGKKDTTNNHPPFVVKTCDVSNQLKLIVQTITVHNANENREHTFTHMVSTCWNDKGEEFALDRAVKLIKLIMAHKQKNKGTPIVIHCADGIGKTGVLLTVLKAIKTMDTEGRVDVCETVQQLRSERKYFVPTLTHYTACYSILNEYYKSD